MLCICESSAPDLRECSADKNRLHQIYVDAVQMRIVCTRFTWMHCKRERSAPDSRVRSPNKSCWNHIYVYTVLTRVFGSAFRRLGFKSKCIGPGVENTGFLAATIQRKTTNGPSAAPPHPKDMLRRTPSELGLAGPATHRGRKMEAEE